MCCFSRPVKFVGDTQIFARMGAKGNQVLIYQMAFEAAEDLAMILPIPVRSGTGEGGVTFVNLEGYPKIFQDVERSFPAVVTLGLDRGAAAGSISEKSALKVEKVGSFEASFVPTIGDFERLDPRFRIDPEIWAKIPAYADFGFAVFKLRAGKSEVHPMAFAFPTRHTDRIFFPTVHIHDGEVHQEEKFDHSLYCQTDNEEVKMNWQESAGIASQFIKERRAKETIRPDDHLYKRTLIGRFPNEDVLIPAV